MTLQGSNKKSVVNLATHTWVQWLHDVLWSTWFPPIRRVDPIFCIWNDFKYKITFPKSRNLPHSSHPLGHSLKSQTSLYCDGETLSLNQGLLSAPPTKPADSKQVPSEPEASAAAKSEHETGLEPAGGWGWAEPEDSVS